MCITKNEYANTDFVAENILLIKKAISNIMKIAFELVF